MLLSSVAEIIIVIDCPVFTVDGLTDLSCIIGWSSESWLITETVAKVGEKIEIKRFGRFAVNE